MLPFDNMSGDPEQVYFSDGITEDIIAGLGRFRELGWSPATVPSSSEAGRRIRRKSGEGLGPDFIVEGSVRRAGIACG